MTENSHYRIMHTVASGGTAVLYKAVQVSLDRVVAVKRLHQHLTTDENFTRRFVLEAKAAASLDHENIVRVIDFGVEDNAYQMVMEFVEGESLKDVLERWRPVSAELALAVVHQICRGLEHAHAKGIVHRDVKPGNVLLTRMGAVKITDFGLAKLTQATTVQTAADSILGTPLYMSPEQAFGESVDQRSDLFSLGTVLYELLTGRQPFASENYMGVIQNIIHKDIAAVRTLNKDVPAPIEALTMKALAKNREQRFQSAREFRIAIETILGADGLNHALGRVPALLERAADTRLVSRPVAAGSVADWASTSSPMRRRKARGTGTGRRPVTAMIAVASLAVAGYFAWPYVDAARGPVATAGDVQHSAVSPVGDSDFASALDAPASAAHAADSSGAMAAPVVTHEVDSVPADPPAAEPIATPTDTSTTEATAAAPAEPSAEAPTTTTPTEPARKAPARPARDPEPERFREGYLSITADPHAEVYVNGVYRGLANPSLRLTLNAGTHTIECRGDRHETYSESLRIIAGELSRRSVTLRQLKGIISLATTEGAEFYVDGELIGITPILRPIEVEAGTHTLTIKKTNYYTWTSDVTVEANATLPLRITLSPRY